MKKQDKKGRDRELRAEEKSLPSKPKKYQSNVFKGELGKDPTVFKRETADDVMQLRMMTR